MERTVSRMGRQYFRNNRDYDGDRERFNKEYNMQRKYGYGFDTGRYCREYVSNGSLAYDGLQVLYLNDYFARITMVLTWKLCRSNSMRVYNCTSGQINNVSWRDFGLLTQEYARQYPTKYLSWYPGFSYTTNRFLHSIYAVLCQTLPACIFDLILYCTKRKPM